MLWASVVFSVAQCRESWWASLLAGSVKSALWPCLYFFLTRMSTFFFTCNFELSTDYETLLLLNYIEVPHEVHVQPLDRLLRSRLSRLVLRLNLASQTTWRRTATRITIHHALLRKHLEVI